MKRVNVSKPSRSNLLREGYDVELSFDHGNMRNIEGLSVEEARELHEALGRHLRNEERVVNGVYLTPKAVAHVERADSCSCTLCGVIRLNGTLRR